MTEDQIKETVFGIISKIAPEADLNNLDPAVKFRDQFEFSSVDFLAFVLKLQNELNIEIPETDCPELAALAGCFKYFKLKFPESN